MLELHGDSIVPLVVAAFVRDVMAWAETEYLQQELQQMNQAEQVGSDVASIEKYESEMHQFGPVYPLEQKRTGKSEHWAAEQVVLSAEDAEKEKAGCLEPDIIVEYSSQQMGQLKLPKERKSLETKTYHLRHLNHSKHYLCLVKQDKQKKKGLHSALKQTPKQYDPMNIKQ